MNRPSHTDTAQSAYLRLPPFWPPPGSKDRDIGSAAWWHKLAGEWRASRTQRAIFLAFSIEVLQTAQAHWNKMPGLLPTDFPICYPKIRIRYLNETGEEDGGSPHASCIMFLPNTETWEADVKRFSDCFEEIGAVVVPQKSWRTWRRE